MAVKNSLGVTVTATTDASDFNPTRQGVSTQVSDSMITHIPQLNRNITDLAKLSELHVIARNSCGAYGGGISLWEGSNPRVWSNTLVQNQGPLGGGGIYLTRSAGADLQRNILAFHSVGGGLVREPTALTPSFGCNDAWSNTPSNYLGVTNPTGTGGNFTQDPLFCYLGTLDLHLEATSPCATLLSPPGCNLVGALDVSCGPTRVRRGSWGSLKAGYR